MSPESLMGNLQGPESDIWALGILLYELHMGKEPFSGKSSSDMLHLISNQPIKFSSKHFTREAMHLTKALLKFKPNKRITIPEIFQSKFLKNTRGSIKRGGPAGVSQEGAFTQSPVLNFNPPQTVFTSKFESKKASISPKPRPRFMNMEKFKSMLGSKGSLYQPSGGELPDSKSFRRVSRLRNPKVMEKVIQPKIYLQGKTSSASRSPGILRSEPTPSSDKQRHMYSKQSMGFLSKEEYGTSSKEMQVSSFFPKQSDTKDTGLQKNSRKGTPSKGRRDDQLSHWSSHQPTRSERLRSLNGSQAKAHFQHSLLPRPEKTPSEDNSQLIRSQENHFVTSKKSDFQLIKKVNRNNSLKKIDLVLSLAFQN